MTIRLSALCIAILAGGCSETPAPSSATAPPTRGEVAETPTPTEEAPVTAKNENMTLRFADGSGNQYTFSSASAQSSGHLVYDPVVPEESSSGTYSGGEPAELDLEAEKNTELWSRAKTLARDTAEHTATRGMGTGSFRISGPAQEASFLVKMGPKLSEFVTFVESLRGSKE